MSREAMKLALDALEINNKAWKALADSGDAGFWEAEEQPFYELSVKAITALREALAKPDFWEGYVPEPDKRQQALDKKAENARELGLDYEPAQQEPVAWMHVMDNTEGHKANKPYVLFTKSKRNPFGVAGRDYSKSYPVTKQPLYTTPPPCPTCEALARTVMLDQTGRDA